MEDYTESREAAGCRCCEEMVARARGCIREHPVEAALAGAFAGFVFAQFPLRRLAAVGIVGGMRLLKPAAALYGLYRLAEDCHAGRWCARKPAEGETDAGI